MSSDGAAGAHSPLPLVAAALVLAGGAAYVLAGPGSAPPSGPGVWPGQGAAAPDAHVLLAQPEADTVSTPARFLAGAAQAAPRAERDVEWPVTRPDFDTAVKESEFLAAYLQLAGEDPVAFEARAQRTLEALGLDDGPPACEGVALLRAAYAAGSEHAAELCVQAALLPTRSGARGSLPEFAVRFLGEQAAADPQARTALETLAFGSAPATPGLRRRAACGFAAHADPVELGRLAARLAREQDPLLVEGVLVSLARNPERPGVAPILAAYGRWPAAAQDGAQEP